MVSSCGAKSVKGIPPRCGSSGLTTNDNYGTSAVCPGGQSNDRLLTPDAIDPAEKVEITAVLASMRGPFVTSRGSLLMDGEVKTVPPCNESSM